MMALLCAIFSGALFYFSMGLDNVWALAWFAPLPLLWLATGDAPRWQVFAASLTAFAAGQIYMVQAYGGELPWFALAGMMLGMGALFAFAVGQARIVWRAGSPWISLVGFPALWTAIEFLYSLVSPHATFGALAYSQVSWPLATQIASVLGLHAITFLLCLFANALALMARGALRPALAGILVCILVLGYGHVRLAQPQSGNAVRVALLADWQGRQQVSRRLDRAATQAMAERYAAAAGHEAARGARLIVIPESALIVDRAWQSDALKSLSEVARQANATIVAGVVQARPWRNMALSFTPDGAVRAYDKRHLLLPGEGRFTPGTGPGLLDKGQAVAICKDLDFPRTLRGDARAGDIRILAVPANDFVEDGWIHARMAVMRGVENGFVVVRAAFNGLETVSDAQGRILASAATTGPGMTVLRAQVFAGPGATPYTRIGDVFAWLCVVFASWLCAVRLKRRRAPA